MGLSYLPQEASVFRKLNVEENIRAVLELQIVDGKPLSAQEIERRLDALLDDLQIAHLRQNPALFPGGERRRGNRARAGFGPALHPARRTVRRCRPDRGGRDPAYRQLPGARNIGVLITDHNVRETLGICDHAYIISEGAVLAEGRPQEIIANESVRRVYLGENFRM